ncbi:hypothetical protein MYP14_19155 [Rhodococcus pyridinivorans]|uniref:hypothetical protein n=1 Tax=Rhodococcus pyridinivorans TaxID=103816 RepID=UPI0020001AA8|nr:hypothetical protein [Rhodococcus pyridinivorans]UPK62847.1 hypothetical protein MYP14_19155 [Rhodococcus pyridinivorans]
MNDQTLAALIADSQIYIDIAHRRLLEDGTDTFADAYRDAFVTLCSGLYDTFGRTHR